MATGETSEPVSTGTQLIADGFEALHVSGELDRARTCFEIAAVRADAADDREALGLAAIGLGGLWVGESRSAVWRAQTRAWRSRALTMTDPSSSLHLRLTLRDVAEMDYLDGRCDRILHSLDLARKGRDPLALAEGLRFAHHCMLGPEHAARRLTIADELIGVGAFSGRRIDTAMGLLWRTVDLFLLGDRRAERSLAELRSYIDALGHLALKFVTSAIEVMVSIRSGRLDRAEELARLCRDEGTQAGDDDALGWYGAHLGLIRWYQGRTDEMVGLCEDLMPSPTLADANLAFVAGLAVSAGAAGDTVRAAAALHRLRGRSLADMPSSSTWLVQIAASIQAARLLGDREAAGEAYELLLQYQDLPVMASLAVACFGTAHYWLGLAAAVTGNQKQAERHFRLSIQTNDIIGNIPARALSRLELAGVLRQSGLATKDARAHGEAADEELRSLGMQRWLSNPSRTPTKAAMCFRSGAGWHVAAFGMAADVRDSVGMSYLAQLLAHPDKDIRAVDLVTVFQRPPEADSEQPVLDRTALLALRRRLTELRETEDRAILAGDQQLSGRAHKEYVSIERELQRSAGFAGHAETFHGDEERARVAVQKALRRALEAITTASPELGGRLSARVVTGRLCTFRTR